MFILGATLTVHNPLFFLLTNCEGIDLSNVVHRAHIRTHNYEHITRPRISSLCKIKVSSAICLKQRCMTSVITNWVLNLLVGPPYTSSLFLVIHSLLTIKWPHHKLPTLWRRHHKFLAGRSFTGWVDSKHAWNDLHAIWHAIQRVFPRGTLVESFKFAIFFLARSEFGCFDHVHLEYVKIYAALGFWRQPT